MDIPSLQYMNEGWDGWMDGTYFRMYVVSLVYSVFLMYALCLMLPNWRHLLPSFYIHHFFTIYLHRHSNYV